MANLKVLGEKPPAVPDKRLQELRDYIFRINDELEYLLTHLDRDNFSEQLNIQMDKMKEQIDGAEKQLDEVEEQLGGMLSKIRSRYYTVLYDFTGSLSTVVTLGDDAENYQLLTMQLFDSGGNLANAVTQPPRIFRNTTAKIYGNSSSQWGSFKLETDGNTGQLTKATFNRTSANTTKVRIIGCGKVFGEL